MSVYINSAVSYSALGLEEKSLFGAVTPNDKNFVSAVEPSYKDVIPPAMIRRMSKVIKLSVMAGLSAHKLAGASKLDGIVCGTGIGCFDDTDKFLLNISQNNEQLPPPTAFIQSTHNSAAGQIALMMKCHEYNMTYVQQSLSFESALLDASMMLHEGESNVLVGGLDENTPSLVELFSRAGHLKSGISEPVWKSTTKGFKLGEGVAFFMLGNGKNEQTIAQLNGLEFLQKIKSEEDLVQTVKKFFQKKNIPVSDISFVLSGNCGDVELDRKINKLNQELFIDTPRVYFKEFSGEHFSSSAFALWAAAEILKYQELPANITLDSDKRPSELKHGLIINHYGDKDYSLILVSK